MALWVPNWQLSLLFYAIPSALASAFLAPAFAIVQNGVGASQRATTSAILLFTLNMIGLGEGPLFVGMVSDWAAPASGNELLTFALAMLAPFFLLAAALQYLTAKSLVQQARPARLERTSARRSVFGDKEYDGHSLVQFVTIGIGPSRNHSPSPSSPQSGGWHSDEALR